MKQDQCIYRGGFVYSYDRNGIIITITLGPLSKGEKTNVTTYAWNISLDEEVEHCDTVDLYHFPVYIGARIKVTITTPYEIQEAWYIVNVSGIEECSQDIWLDIVQAGS